MHFSALKAQLDDIQILIEERAHELASEAIERLASKMKKNGSAEIFYDGNNVALLVEETKENIKKMIYQMQATAYAHAAEHGATIATLKEISNILVIPAPAAEAPAPRFMR
ncbi:MAG TPA: hypothetical protein VNC84_07045 [Gammaproteobacteria bacterium]|jgi:hypothetical protein|nr:hypothetical protein [Gammaproteobacteria bacterium]